MFTYFRCKQRTNEQTNERMNGSVQKEHIFDENAQGSLLSLTFLITSSLLLSSTILLWVS